MKVFVVVATWKEDGNPRSEVMGVYEDVWYANQQVSSLNKDCHLDPDIDHLDYEAEWHEAEVE